MEALWALQRIGAQGSEPLFAAASMNGRFTASRLKSLRAQFAELEMAGALRPVRNEGHLRVVRMADYRAEPTDRRLAVIGSGPPFVGIGDGRDGDPRSRSATTRSRRSDRLMRPTASRTLRP